MKTHSAKIIGLFLYLWPLPLVQAAAQIKGTVVDVANQPVENAAIQYYEPEPGYGLGKVSLLAETKTDSRGNFVVKGVLLRGTIVVKKPGMAYGWITLYDLPREPVFIRLTHPKHVAGIVVDGNGKPVSAAEVFATTVVFPGDEPARRQQLLQDQPAKNCYYTRTGDDGRFRLDGFPEDSGLNLVALTPDKATAVAGNEVMDLSSMAYFAEEENIRLVVEPTGTVQGRIVGQAGNRPVPIAELILDPGPPFGMFSERLISKSRLDGTFVIPNVPVGLYMLYAVFGTNGVPEWVAPGVNVSVEAGKVTTGVEVAAVRGGALEVSVVKEAGSEPAPCVEVAIRSGNLTYMGVTDERGLCTVRMPAGESQIIVRQARSAARYLSEIVEEDKTNKVEVTLPLPVRITGTVRKPDGSPAGKVYLRTVESTRPVAETVSDAVGSFELERPGSDSETTEPFAILARDVANRLAALVEVFPDSTDKVEIALAPAVSFVGEVHSNGGVVTNVTAAVTLRGTRYQGSLDNIALNTAQPGQFEIRALP
ncbi:MAG: hypothetical protein N3G20_11025, partial [Verrucomicrobiae bacterium]|nr:hypothetical protein [Verrucomicrobiae bacterium]